MVNSCQVCEKVKNIIEEWINKQGHDRCWYYPDLFKKLAVIFNIENKQVLLPSREEFEKGCELYQDEQYNH